MRKLRITPEPVIIEIEDTDFVGNLPVLNLNSSTTPRINCEIVFHIGCKSCHRATEIRKDSFLKIEEVK